MRLRQILTEAELAALAKKCRVAAGKNRAEAARELGVARPSLVQAEDCPERSFTRLRIRIIEQYSAYKIQGPLFRLAKE